MAFPTGWGRYCAVVIDADQVSGTSHSDFPVLITEDMLPSEMFDADGSYPALNGGGDIRFTTDTAGSNGLHCEVVSFVTDNNPANGSAEIWVKIPSLSGSGDTTIYVWYNATGESQPAADDATFGSEGVWSGYVIAAHLKEVAGSTAVNSTGGTDGTYGGGLPDRLGIGQDFDGSLDYIDFGPSALGISSALTFQIKAKPDSITGVKQLFTSDNDSVSGKERNWQWRINTNDVEFIRFNASDAVIETVSDLNRISSGATHWIAITFDTTNGTDIYVNGSASGASSNTTAMQDNGGTDSRSIVGSRYKTGDYTNELMDGELGELRVRASVLSADWIATEYANQNSPATFAAAGTPVSAGGGGVSAELTGNSSTAAVGTLGVATEGSVSVTPSGVSATSTVGTLGATAEINASAELTGVFSSGAVGTITAEVGGGATANLSGNESVASVGALGVSTEVNAFVDLLGNSATGAVGTLIVVTGLQVALSGNAATGAVGTLGVTAEVNASAALTGVGSSGAVGTLEITVPITVSVELTGVGSTGAIGTLTAVGAGQVWTEITPVSTIWTEIS